MQRFYTVPGVKLSKKSRYYLDPTKSNLGVDRIIKPKDPILMEKNKDLIAQLKKDAADKKRQFSLGR